MNKLILLVIIFSLSGFSKDMHLKCEGTATITDTKVSTSSAQAYGGGTSAYGSGSTVTSSDYQVATELIFHLYDGYKDGYIQLPSIMRPMIGGRKKDKFELKNIVVSDNEIRTEFKINLMNKPKITISRLTGRMEYKSFASPKNFSGNCSILDTNKKKF